LCKDSFACALVTYEMRVLGLSSVSLLSLKNKKEEWQKTLGARPLARRGARERRRRSGGPASFFVCFRRCCCLLLAAVLLLAAAGGFGACD
jgi:hypothetical protein